MSLVAVTETVRFSRSRETPKPRMVDHGPLVQSGWVVEVGDVASESSGVKLVDEGLLLGKREVRVVAPPQVEEAVHTLAPLGVAATDALEKRLPFCGSKLDREGEEPWSRSTGPSLSQTVTEQ